MSRGARVGRSCPAARISSSRASRPPWVRATATTWAPAAARARAAARPMPRLAPVTRAILPFRAWESDMGRLCSEIPGGAYPWDGLSVDQDGELALKALVAAFGDLAIEQPGR